MVSINVYRTGSTGKSNLLANSTCVNVDNTLLDKKDKKESKKIKNFYIFINQFQKLWTDGKGKVNIQIRKVI